MNTQPDPLQERQASGGGRSTPEGKADECERRETDAVQGSAMLQHMFAGGVAGITEHIAMYPVDTIKTRMQALAHPGQQLRGVSMKRAVQAVLKREGWRGLYGGVGAVAMGAGPAHAIYYAVYEEAKELFGGNTGTGHHPFATAAAGSLATATGDAINLPLDVVKQRLQVMHSPYNGVRHCVTRMLAEEGIGAFYKSYKITLIMNVPFTAIHFATYESAKKLLSSHDESEGLLTQLTAGGLAGGISAACTTPMDVVKTRLQLEGVQDAARHPTTSLVLMLRRILEKEGSAALWSGIQPRVLFHVPAAAISWGVYESMKRFMGIDPT